MRNLKNEETLHFLKVKQFKPNMLNAQNILEITIVLARESNKNFSPDFFRHHTDIEMHKRESNSLVEGIT